MYKKAEVTQITEKELMNFPPSHCFALEQLVEQDTPTLEAIDLVNQMTKDDAESITFSRIANI